MRKALQTLWSRPRGDGLLRSAHDCAEAACHHTRGVYVRSPRWSDWRDLPPVDARTMDTGATLFSESASRVVVSVAREHVGNVLERAGTLGVPAREIGTTGTGRINVSINGQTAIDIAVNEAEHIWDGALGKYFKQRAA